VLVSKDVIYGGEGGIRNHFAGFPGNAVRAQMDPQRSYSE